MKTLLNFIMKNISILLLRYPIMQLVLLFISILIFRIVFIGSIAYCDGMIVNLIKAQEEVEASSYVANLIKAQKDRSLMSLKNELKNKDFITQCPTILKNILQDIFALDSAKLPLEYSLLQYTDTSLIAIHEHFAAYGIPLRNPEITKALLLLLAKTDHPLIFHIICIYLTDSFFLLEAKTGYYSNPKIIIAFHLKLQENIYQRIDETIDYIKLNENIN